MATATIKQTAVRQLLLVLTLAAVLMAGCSDDPQPPGQNDSLTLALSRSFLSTPLYLAQLKGFFTDEGLDIILQEYPSGKLSTKAMLSGEVDVSTVADLPIVMNGFKGENFYIFCTFSTSYSFLKILARKDHGISEAKDLKGKRVGANKGTSSYYFLGAFLTNHLLTMKDIDMVHFKTTNLSAALINNEVDAISVWQPHERQAIETLGQKVIALPTEKIYRTTFNLACKRDFAKIHLSALKKLIQAIHRAAQYARDNKIEATELIAEQFGIESSLVASYWPEYTFGVNLEQALLVQLDDIARWAVASKLVPGQRIPNFFNYIFLDIMSGTFPEQISIIH